jgi:hypothetical protein
MVTWSRDYNETVSSSLGDERLSLMRKTSAYYFPTEHGIRGTRYFCERYQAKSVLDYGCGEFECIVVPKGTDVTYYDPFVPSKNYRPDRPSDLVFLNHVLNGVEPDFLEEVLEDVKGFCNKAIICLIRMPGMYNMMEQDYAEKFKRRGLIIKERYSCSIRYFFDQIQAGNFNKPLRVIDEKQEPKHMLYVLLEKDPNF